MIEQLEARPSQELRQAAAGHPSFREREALVVALDVEVVPDAPGKRVEVSQSPGERPLELGDERGPGTVSVIIASDDVVGGVEEDHSGVDMGVELVYE